MKNDKVALKESQNIALGYMKILTDVARESFLILDHDLRVISANKTFYQNFLVTPIQTENKLLYDLGNGQWNIPQLRNLLEKILSNREIIKNYEVTHIFEAIGKKTILLNARQIDSVQLIILAMEDITDKKNLEIKLAEYVAELEDKITENKMMIGREIKMVELKKEIERLKRK